MLKTTAGSPMIAHSTVIVPEVAIAAADSCISSVDCGTISNLAEFSGFFSNSVTISLILFSIFVLDAEILKLI